MQSVLEKHIIAGNITASDVGHLPFEINEEKLIAQSLLDATDFYMTVDKYAELDTGRQSELTDYRKTLRDIVNGIIDTVPEKLEWLNI